MSKRKISVEDKLYAVNLYLDGKESQHRIAGEIEKLHTESPDKGYRRIRDELERYYEKTRNLSVSYIKTASSLIHWQKKFIFFSLFT